MLSPLVTLFGSILAFVAIGLIPGRTAIKEGKTERYNSWGKMAIFVLAFLVLGIGGYVLYLSYSDDAWDAFSTGNIALFIGIGLGLVINNIWITRKLKALPENSEDEAQEVEAVEVQEIEEAPAEEKAPVKKAPIKKTKKAVPTPAKKPAAVPRPVPRTAPVKTAPKEPEVEAPPIDKCPYCDTSLDYLQDGKCPVCGEKVEI